jgi:hypothetical protein
MKRIIATTAVCAVASGGVALVAASGGGAQTPATGQTFTLIERTTDSDFSFIDNKPTSPKPGKHGPHISRGDQIAFSSPVFDTNGKRMGRTDAGCVASEPGTFDANAVFTCYGGFRLVNGTILVQQIGKVSAKVSHLVITGGTGAYAGARGSIVSTTNSDTKSTDVVTLLP